MSEKEKVEALLRANSKIKSLHVRLRALQVCFIICYAICYNINEKYFYFYCPTISNFCVGTKRTWKQ